MYLKSIEVQGFKSFANKMTLEFKDGITGIVGPNGSGKSNIADAVRWVLGEQSAKQLRGSKMEDVIFSGTQTRKPLGFAYVTITMDNTDHKLPIDFDEVVVSRRVYRSGESEYQINGTTCRLKDINELFLDTGIGKEGYSIIGQGQIDKILSGKPEDRRELFDEAAGIVKYKRRKIAAEKNLEEEKLNLSRVTDIINEIEKQLIPLEKQSATAKVYLKYKEELKGLEICQFLKEYDKLSTNKEQIDNKLLIVTEDLDNTTKEYDRTKEEYLKLEDELDEFNRNIDEAKNSSNELKLNKEKAEGEIKVLNEQISSMLQNDEYYQSRISTGEKDIETKYSEEQDYLSQKVVIDEKISKVDDLLSSELEALQKIKENIISYSKEIDECNNAIFDTLNINSSIKSNIQRYETILEQNALRKAELNQKLLKNRSDSEQYAANIEKYQQELKDISSLLSDKTKERSHTEQSIQDTQTRIDNITLKLTEVQGNFLNERSRLNSLINLTERYEGYGNSIKKVMERKGQVPGIIGVVADIIKTDKRYETAIETALGLTIQNIVTEDEKTAKDMIEYLKQNKLGRATFLPLCNISAGTSLHNNKAITETGVVGIASELVTTASSMEGQEAASDNTAGKGNNNKFQTLVDYLLGRIIVVDNIDNASKLARKYNYTLRIVTLEGELLTPGGSISGGAYKNSNNLLGRRREISELEEIVTALENKSKELLEKKDNEKSNKTKLKQDLEALNILLQDYFIKQNTAKMNLDKEISQKAETEAICQEYLKELSEIDYQAKELMQQLDELNNKLTNNLTASRDKEDNIDKLAKLLDEERAKEQLANDSSSSLKLELSSLEQTNQFILENIKRVKREIDKLTEEGTSLKAEILKSTQAVEEKRQNIIRAKDNIALIDKSIEDLETIINELINKKDNVTKVHKNFFARREELSNRMNELDKESYRLNGQKEKILEQSDFMMNYMWEEYELTYSTALMFSSIPDLSMAQAKKCISEIKQNIKELGDVNVNAIEDYKNLSERYTFLSEQREDLIKSEEVLLQVICELEEEMRKQFEKEFAAIQVQFDLVFKELFGGGKADLELTEDDDILQAGVRINAQPPGKKLQNMMQLSGGEKALTAIALLFAIQNLKPSPFCLLDEIEAALDDSNVKRFAKYLNKLTKDTQFIIITHRRGTMAAANTLYGITMQEKGISTLVAVSLIENELDK